jgi:hypothetical protein
MLVAVAAMAAVSIVYAPTAGHAATAPPVVVGQARTYDDSGRVTNRFAPGATIRYAVLVRVSGRRAPLDVSWNVSNSAQAIYSYSTRHTFAPGYYAIYSPSQAPDDAAGAYDNSVSVTFRGHTVVRHSSLTISGGRVCMFHAAVSVIGQEIGHVGWAFRTAPGDRWEFGGTEFLDFNNWIHTGNWQNVLAAFRSPPTPIHAQYGDYRCLDVPTAFMHPTAANITAHLGQLRRYDLLLDNCLTRSVEVFNAYGLDLPPGDLEAPSTYFQALPDTTDSKGDSQKWGPIVTLQR